MDIFRLKPWNSHLQSPLFVPVWVSLRLCRCTLHRQYEHFSLVIVEGAQVQLIPLATVPFYSIVPVSHDSATGSQHDQHRRCETEAGKWNSDIPQSIIYTCAFSCCDMSKCLQCKSPIIMCVPAKALHTMWRERRGPEVLYEVRRTGTDSLFWKQREGSCCSLTADFAHQLLTRSAVAATAVDVTHSLWK